MAESHRTRLGDFEVDYAARTRRRRRAVSAPIRPRRIRAAIGAVAIGAVALAGCGGSSSSKWEGLRSVSVTVSRPGLPPPGGAPQTTLFTSASAVAQATASLNAHHIKQGSSSSSNPGCAGGEQIAITIVRQHGAPVHLSAYQCGGHTSGDVSGDLSGFLTSIGP